jgi:hypothetical protein
MLFRSTLAIIFVLALGACKKEIRDLQNAVPGTVDSPVNDEVVVGGSSRGSNPVYPMEPFRLFMAPLVNKFDQGLDTRPLDDGERSLVSLSGSLEEENDLRVTLCISKINARLDRNDVFTIPFELNGVSTAANIGRDGLASSLPLTGTALDLGATAMLREDQLFRYSFELVVGMCLDKTGRPFRVMV